MKKILLVLSAACILAASCRKSGPASVATEEPATLTVSIANGLTRASATPTSAESAIDAAKVYLFVFKADGSREYGRAVTLTSGSTTVDLTAGAKTVWVVANCPSSVTSAADYDAFRAKVSSLSDNSTSHLVMAGGAAKTISGDDAVSVTLRRLASKVCLVSFTRDFTDAIYAASTLTLNRVYLSNVCGECRYFSDGATTTSINPASVSVWYNRLGVCSLTGGDPVPLLSAAVGQDIADGGSYTAEKTLYAYPNACTADSHDGTWDMAANPRHTRLVFDVTLAGTQGYYHVSLPTMDSNKVYNVSLTVHKRPSGDPEDNDPEIDPSLAFTVNVSVAEWDAPISITEEL